MRHQQPPLQLQHLPPRPAQLGPQVDRLLDKGLPLVVVRAGGAARRAERRQGPDKAQSLPLHVHLSHGHVTQSPYSLAHPKVGSSYER